MLSTYNMPCNDNWEKKNVLKTIQWQFNRKHVECNCNVGFDVDLQQNIFSGDSL